ncbi:MAG: TonB-dependent receptor [Bacteroidetes bacterium CG18_big_fil_WC_8_21_14_2_50_41_14]|nr:MAG: TonB-dependent receptor [Bacteroidetes bacterium CG18_big_fil_WC_8_21_14_2_50_41_14]
MKIRTLLVFLFVFCLSITQVSLKAQEATVRGFLYEEESGEPAIFANVVLKGTNFGASTDINGYFLISKIPPGDYTLMVTYLGFDTISELISLSKGALLNKKLFVKKGSFNLETVTVSAERTEARTETKMSVVKISPKDIKQIPSVGGQADFAQYLQVVPGVVFTGDQGGQFYIRGGSPIQNKVMLDGMTIYNPFHSIGLFSVFETDLIRNASIYTGGYNAEYGGRISSVMDITTKDGNKKHLSGVVGGSTFGARAMIEGPIKKQNSPNEGSASFVLSFKNSYLAESSKVFYNYVDKDGLPFNFADIYGKVTLNAANGSKISLFGFNFTDNVSNYKAISDFGWNSFGGGSSFVVIPGKAPVLIEGIVAYSKYETMVKSTTLNDRKSAISGFNAAINFTYFMGKNELKYGVELEGYRTEYLFKNFVNAEINQTENTTQLGLYAKYKFIVNKFIIEPGFRLEWYASLAEASPEPRLAIKYNANDWFRLKFAGGVYSQNFIAASSDRDVVNLFYGFLSGPENLPDQFDGKKRTSRIQKADHLIFGAEFDLSNSISLNVEGYYKYFPQLTNINRNKLYNESEAPQGASEVEYKDFILEKGNAYGMDMVLKYDYKKVYVWLVYSLGFVTRQFEDKYGEMVSYTPHFDRRHNVNFVFSYITGPKLEWEFGARWNLGTGFPFTQPQGFYESLTFPDGINSNVGTENGNLGVIYGDLYNGRLPVYHRLDIDVKRNFFLSANTKLVADLSVTNVYDRKNVFYVDLITSKVVYQLPFMPSFGLSLYF